MKLPHACVICRRWFWPPGGLCSECRTKLSWQVRPTLRPTPVRTRALLSWASHDSPALTWLAYGLKGRESLEFWRDFALWMLERWPTPPSSAVLVPMPRRHHQTNHARGLANALAHWTGRKVREPLTHSGASPSQKALSRSARGEVKMRLKPNENCKEYTAVWLIDDVITTGATMAAAHTALGRPDSCEAWCLLDRRPCESEWPLL